MYIICVGVAGWFCCLPSSVCCWLHECQSVTVCEPTRRCCDVARSTVLGRQAAPLTDGADHSSTLRAPTYTHITNATTTSPPQCHMGTARRHPSRQRMHSPASCAISCAMPTADESSHSAAGTLHPHRSATCVLLLWIREINQNSGPSGIASSLCM